MLLRNLAEDFKKELNETFNYCFDSEPFFIPTQLSESKIEILTSKGDYFLPLGPIEKEFSCLLNFRLTLDRTGEYLAVDESKFQFFYNEKPVFRYEFESSKSLKRPNSHLHVHAEISDFAKLQDKKKKEAKVGELWSMHFPLGGTEMRPSLEEILLSCNFEFGLGLNKKQISYLYEKKNKFKELQALTIARKYANILRNAGWISPPNIGEKPPINH